MRALIYSRFSSDKQRETSVDDQVRVCRTRAEAESFDVVGQYSDQGISGSTPVDARAGGSRMLADALADRFDVLIVEGLDRLSRDQVEQERIIRRLEHRGIRIIGVADAYDSQMGARKIMRGVRGMINELYLDDLRHKTHRGQAGQFERGFVVGGKSYGYDIVKTEAGSRYQINEAEAVHVRWIYSMYADGWGVQRIAHELNNRGIPAPRGGTWAVSAIFGAPRKGSGIINNELYSGRYIWNRSQWSKDPDTGKRQRVERPESEWRYADVPDLRIVDEELWQATRDRIAGNRMAMEQGGLRARTLFGGLLKCALCGGAIIAINKHSYGCSKRKDRGLTVCRGITVARSRLDARLLGVLREELLAPKSIADLERYVRAALGARKLKGSSATDATLARVAELNAEIGRIVDAIAKIGYSEALQQRLAAAEVERGKLATIVPVPEAKIPTVNEVMAMVRSRLLNVQDALQGTDIMRTRTLLRDLFGKGTLVRRKEAIYAEFQTTAQQMQLAATGSSTYLKVVAGVGFEPTTFGL
ncbi:recombinase family protein [Paraburkholderia nemoris]|uniref:recombinase family protein n=1 Tax=Paraburkholderia nemoris TaxID=2793076 RepID=UPI0038BD4AA5